jgi:hypothetical protein
VGEEAKQRTIYFVIANCTNKERTQLKEIVIKNGDRWPINKNQLGTKYFNKFRIFISSIDFESNQS